jgi:hypothetical protein
MPLPITPDLRTNLGTWAVPTWQVPAVSHFMHDALPNESFDPHFYGQRLSTTYFDTREGVLRRARSARDKYITLRVRCYQPRHGEEVYALSAKTENQKFRMEITPDTAHALVSGTNPFPRVADILPADLLARLLDISEEGELEPCVAITCRRYAIEDDQDRFTLDTDIHTDLGKVMTHSVLEFKSTKNKNAPAALRNINLHSIKLSKFLWATRG